MTNATGRRAMRLVYLFAIAVCIAPQLLAQTPPQYNPVTTAYTNGSAYGGGAAIAPQPWPAESQWVPYSWGTTYPDPVGDHAIKDLRSSADPSNGGTTPQNYVSVSSGCPDSTLPSIYYYFNTTTKTVYFRWRVNQIANNYATGPSAGAYGNTSPWNSALWTVFFSLTGTGYRDFAAHLDGSSGAPAQPVDVLRTVWSAVQSNSIDWISTPGIYSVFTNPTAFVNSNTGQLEQFNGSAAPQTVQWPNGSSETIWDYGTTRSINISTSSCTEYYVDYEIPMSMLDATAVGGPKMTENTPFQFLFATANSLNNPFQKDVVWEGSFVCDATSPGPFGDALTLAGGIIPQPISTSITAGTRTGCTLPIRAQIMDALNVTNCQTISQIVQAQFFYWFDANGNGIADEANGSWFPINDPATPVGTIVTTNWNLSNLVQGQYLLALEISDSATRNHTTQTWATTGGSLTQPFGTDNNGTPPNTTRHLYTNVPNQGITAASLGVNYVKVTIPSGCGAPPPSITKTHPAGSNTVTSGSPITFTLTINNTSLTTIPLTQITDTLPTGFSYNSNNPGGSSITPSSSPSANATGTITWNFSGVNLGPSSTTTFSYIANAGSSAGTFFNTATAVTAVGNLNATDSGVTVTTAALTAAKSSALASNPSVATGSFNAGDVVRFTITYTNNSSTQVNSVTVSDALPTGFNWVGPVTGTPASNPSVGSNGTVTYSTGNLAVGASVTLAFDATATVAGSFTNTARVQSANAPEVDPATPVSVAGPVLAIAKTANRSTTFPPAAGTTPLTYSIQYANVGNGYANLSYLSDTILTGLTFTTAGSSSGCNGPNGVAQITVGNGGSGYTSAPAVTFTGGGGAGAVATASIANGKVVSVTITNPGTGYTSVPTIGFTGGGGAGATATAITNSGVVCTNLGTLAPGATATVTLVFNVSFAALQGATTSNTQTNTATINATNATSQSATFTETFVNNTACNSVTYHFRNTTGLVSSSASNLGVDHVAMTAGGTYGAAPAVTFSAGTVTATGTTSINSSAAVSGVNVTNGGRYSSAPTVTFGAGAPTATGTAVMTSASLLATTTQGNAATQSAAVIVRDLVEISRFYSDPVDANLAYIVSSATIDLGWNRVSGNKIDDSVVLADFNPSTNTWTTISTAGAQINVGGNGNAFGNHQLTFAPANYVLPAGHRLLWIISARDSNGNANTTYRLDYNGTSTTDTAGNFDSRGTVCLTPVYPSLTESVDKLEVNPGIDQLTYTINYANPSSVGLTGVTLTSPLPPGTTFVSATGGGTVVGGNVVWNINALAAGGSGTVTFTVSVPQNITGTACSTNFCVVDTTTLTDDQTGSLTASASSVIVHPDVRISKTASATALVPGNTFSYTVSLVNAGYGTAANVTISDPLPIVVTSTNYTVGTTVTSVAGIYVTNSGSGYTSAPTVTFTGGGGTGAVATASISGGQVVAITITSGGSGYTSAPTIGFTGGGGSGAAANAQIASVTNTAGTLSFSVGTMLPGATVKFVINAQVAATGNAAGTTTYTNTASELDDSIVTPRTASADIQVTATPVLKLGETASPLPLPLTAINVTSGGSGYTSAPTVTVTGCAVTPTAVATVSGGVVTGITVTNGGAGCTAPSVSLTGGGGSGATTSTTTGQTTGGLLNVAIVNPGSGYTSAPTVTVTGCTGATATATISSGIVTGVTITNTGTNCSAAPTIGFTGGGGSGATATAAGGERVVYVNVTAGGSYSAPPTVTATGQNCSGVTAVVSTNPPSNVTAGSYTVTGVTLTNNGSGCTGIPTVTFSGSGSGAAAMATIGAAPGDTVQYQVTVTNTGTADAANVVVSDVIPGSTSWQSGGSFSGGSASQNVGTVAAGGSQTLTYTVKVDNALPNGTTILTTNASATSTNAASPANVGTTVNSGATPQYSIAMTPNNDAVGDPLTALATTASSATTIIVNSSSLLSVGSYVAIYSGTAWQVVKITAISGQFVTLSSGVSAPAGTSLIPVEDYTINYSNIGHATGTNVEVEVRLPAGLLYGGIPTGATATNSDPGVGNTGNVIWSSNLPSGGTTLTNGSSGTLDVLVFPSTAGKYTTVAQIDDGTALNTRNASTTSTTTFGALSPSKVTTTAQVTAGTTAHYSISIQNPLAATAANNVQVLDNLSTGFTYKAGTTVINGNPAANPCTSQCVGFANVTAGGSGYTSAPTVTITGVGTGATAVATISSGVVTGVVITSAGTGYTATPTIAFSGGGGSGAAALASLGSTSSPSWVGQTIAAGGTLTLAFDADVAASVPTGDYENQILVSSSNVLSLTFDYLNTTQENVHVCAPAPAIVAPGPVCANSTGNGASVPSDPNATFTWSITNGTITTSSTGTVDHLTLGGGGTGYTSAPTVVFSGGGGSGAAATAVLSGTSVASFTMTSVGSGYTSAPTVTFSGGGGSGASAAAVLGSGIIYTAGSTSPVTLTVTKTEGSCSTSSNTTVTVSAAPGVTTDITSKTVCPGATLTLSPTIASGSSFQWYVSTNGGTSFSALSNSGACATNCVSGATTTSLQITNVQSAIDGNLYRLTATNGSCSVNTSAATLHVLCALDLELTTNSVSANPVNAGTNITFTQKITNVGSNPTTAQLILWEPIPTNTSFVSMTAATGWTCGAAPVNGVTSIAVTSGGSGYASAPTVTISGGGGSGAKAVAVVSGGAVTSIFVTNPGTGYTSTPSVTFGSGAATATASVSSVEVCTTNNVLAANTATSNFTFVVSTAGSVADGTTVTDTVNVGFTTPDNDTILTNNTKSTSTTVQRRIDVAVFKENNAFNADLGPGYIYPGNPATTTPMNWYVTETNNGPSRATNVTLVDQLPSGFTYSNNMAVTVTDDGSGYNAAPTVGFSGGGGTGATAIAKLGGFVNAIGVTSGGSGYTTAPTVTIGGGGGSGATARADLSDAGDGTILTVTMTNGGSGYTSTPTVSFTGGGGSGAAATANVLGSPNTVAQIVITNVGSGYTSAPAVTLTPTNGGSGAAAAASLCSYTSSTSIVNCSVGTLDKNAVATLTVAGIAPSGAGYLLNTAAAGYTETDTNTANDNASSKATILAPTLVKMLAIDATQSKSNVSITWQTSFEQDNLGFYIWRENAAGEKTRVSKNIIIGSAFFTGKKISQNARRSYRFVDNAPPAGQFVQYYVEDVDIKGVHTMHGPVTPRSGNAGTATGTTTDPDPSVGSLGGIFTTDAGMGVTAPAATGDAAKRLAQQWTVAATPAAKVIVTRPGWVRVKKSDLVAAGFDPGTVSNRISVFADGIEVPIVVPDGSFGSSDAIEFFGTGLDTPTAGGHVYYVTAGIGNALRIKNTTGKAGSGAPAPASTPFTFTRVERSIFFTALTNNGDRDNWLGQLIVNWFGVPVTNGITVSNHDPNGGNAALEIVIQGSTDDFDHAVALSFNGHDLGVARFRSQARNVSNFSVPASWLAEGENTVSFNAVGGDDDISLVESVKLTYAHRFAADNDALAFNAPAGTAVTVGGFTTDQVRVVDLTDPQAPQFLPATVSAASDGTKSVSLVTAGTGTRTVFAFGDGRVQPPAQIVVNAPSTLNAAKNAADLLILTNKAFTAQAANLKAARDAQGISTTVVDVQNVYDEFAYGVHGPEAIRAFLQRAKTSWSKAPRYVILLGDASTDPRNYLGLGNFDFVPTKLVPTAYLKTSSDDWFGDFSDTGLSQLAIGRLPVRTTDEADAVVNKLVRRASVTGPWLKNVEVVNDRNNGVPFDREADQLAALVPSALTTGRISFATTPNPSSAVVDAFNSGSLLTNYIGHGSVEIWSSDVFDSLAAASLTNGDKLPFVVTMNCLNGYFHDLWAESMAEALIKNPSGGAIGVWASSALTSPDQQLRVNLALYRQLFGGGTTPAIGDAILKAKQETTDIDVRRTWILFGDPTLKIQP
jgi:uncharacterized repeat protein (TIGR01451 family)